MSFHCASLTICARATEVAGAHLRSMQFTAVTSPLSLPIIECGDHRGHWQL
jgi:hypothetical protein